MSIHAPSFYSAAFYALLALCIGGGLAIYKTTSVEPAVRNGATSTQATDNYLNRKSPLNHSATTPVPDAPSDASSPSGDRMDTLEAYTRLVEAGVSVSIDPFSGTNGLLTDAAVDLLALDLEQKEVVQSAIDAARLEIESIRKKSAINSIDANGQLSVTCPAFPERGDQIRKILLESLSSKLDTNQFALLEDISNDWKDLDSSHSDFGQTNLTYVFEAHEKGDHVQIRVQRYSDATNPPHRSWSYLPEFLNHSNTYGPKIYLTPESVRYLNDAAAQLEEGINSNVSIPQP